MRWLSLAAGAACALSQLLGAAALRAAEADVVDYYVPRVGVPRTNALPSAPDWLRSASSSPESEPLPVSPYVLAGEGSGPSSPSFPSAAQYLTPRFHRILPRAANANEPARTAVYVATESNVLTALNPRNGDIVWRHIYDAEHELLAFYTFQDVTLAITRTPRAYHARLFHAYSGWLTWEHTTPYAHDNPWASQGFPHVDATFLEGTSDAVVLLGNTIVRLHAASGRVVWTSTPVEGTQDHLIRLTVSGSGADRVVHAVAQSSAAGKKHGILSVYTLNLAGQVIATHPHIKAPGAIRGPVDVAIVHTGSEAEAVWLTSDGSIRIAYLATDPSEAAQAPTIDSIYTLDSDARFARLAEVGPAGSQGMLAAQRSDGRAEVFRLNPKGVKGTHKNWEMEEVAHDAIYSSSIDRTGAAYVHRMYFARAQSQLNLHTLWSEPFQRQGQITGYSFGWDHDSNGAVLAAPAEVVPRGQYQLTVRFVAVTSSGSLRLIQEDKLMWAREEGLSEPAAQAIVDIPPFTPPAALHVLAHESFLARLVRHAHLATQLPAYFRSWMTRLSAPDSVVPPLSGDTASIAGRQRPVEQLSPVRGPNSHSVAPRSLNESQLDTAGVWGMPDPFGFNKVLITATKRGKVYAQLTSLRGQYLWEKSLTGYGSGEGEAEPVLKVLGMYPLAPSLTTQSNSEGDSPHATTTVAIVADVRNSPSEHTVTRVWHMDALTGQFIPPPSLKQRNVNDQDTSSTGFPISIGPASDAFVLPPNARALVDPSWWKHQDQAANILAVVDSKTPAPLVTLYPPTPASEQALQTIVEGHGLYFLLPYEGSELRGYTVVSPRGVTERTWTIPLPAGEKIHAIYPPDLASHTVANQGKVKFDRGSLYKLLNPHAHLVVTHSTESSGRGARALVVDAVSGRILYSLHLPDALVSKTTPLLASWTENWGTLVYFASPSPSIEADNVSQLVPDVHARVASFEVYKDLDGNDVRNVWGTSGANVSSFSPPTSHDANPQELVVTAGVLSFQQTFPLPPTMIPTAVSVTSTQFGITNKALVLTSRQGRVITIPRAFVDPRRPLVPANADPKVKGMPNEDGLLPFDGVSHLPVLPQWMTSHIHQVQQVKHLTFGSARLESYALVWASGLDTFVTRVAPSGTFDLLSAAFNKLQLLLTIAALSIGVLAAKRPVRNKILALRW